MRRRRLLTQVRQEAAEFAQGLKRGMDPAEAVQIVMDNITTAYEYATMQVMTLEEDEYWTDSLGGQVPHQWIREQERLGLQLVHVAGRAHSMGLVERAITLKEAQAALFANVVEAVLREVGLPMDTRHQIHRAVGEKLAVLEGTATEVPRSIAA